jgi:hypothetical protein
MTDAQTGLLFATPIIAVFAVALARMGVIRTAGAVTAVVASVAIAGMLFFTQ